MAITIGSEWRESSRTNDCQAVVDFHDALLPGTIANALRTPFYRSLWDASDFRDFNCSRLAELPLVDKEGVRASGRGAQCREGVICNDVFTTGTTGNPLITVRSNVEQRYILDFFNGLPRKDVNSKFIRGMEFTNPYHGHLVGIPSPSHFHRASIYDAGSFDYARNVIYGSHFDQGVEESCTILMGLERCLRAFTFDTIDAFSGSVPESHLQIVVSYSQFLTAAWKKRLEETWGATVVDRFSISEIFGGGTRCVVCDWYHFEPFVIPEVVGATSGVVLGEGVGLLALTALYPFQQAQPLIRYLTGDLAAVTHTESCRPGTTAIRPLGRARYGVPHLRGDGWLITPSSVLEAVDEIGEIQRSPRFHGVAQVKDPHRVGHPKYRSTFIIDGGLVAVRIEIVLDSQVSDTRRRAILARVAHEVKAANPELRSAINARKAALTVACCDDLVPDEIAQAHSGGVWSDA